MSGSKRSQRPRAGCTYLLERVLTVDGSEWEQMLATSGTQQLY